MFKSNYTPQELAEEAKVYASYFHHVDAETLAGFVNAVAHLKGVAALLDAKELQKIHETNYANLGDKMHDTPEVAWDSERELTDVQKTIRDTSNGYQDNTATFEWVVLQLLVCVIRVLIVIAKK